MNNNEMTQKQNNDENYWYNFFEENVIILLCNLNSNVKKIIETLIIKNEEIKQYLNTIYKINDRDTIQEILDMITAVRNAFGIEINLEDILKCFEIYPEQRQNLFENGIGKFPIIVIKIIKNNDEIIQIIKLTYRIILSLSEEEYCHKQILISDFGLVDIRYEIDASEDKDIVCVLFEVKKLNEMKT